MIEFHCVVFANIHMARDFEQTGKSCVACCVGLSIDEGKNGQVGWLVDLSVKGSAALKKGGN